VYPLGLPALREALADYETHACGRHVDPASVVVSAGSSALIRNLCCLLAHDGGEVLLPRPYYPLYLYSAALAGASVNFYDIDLVTGCIDFASLRRAVSGDTRMVILNSPGNPLGNRLTVADLRQVDEAVASPPSSRRRWPRCRRTRCSPPTRFRSTARSRRCATWRRRRPCGCCTRAGATTR
jgi:aspartate aminotransferase